MIECEIGYCGLIVLYEKEDIAKLFNISEAVALKFLKINGFKVGKYYIDERELLELLHTNRDLLKEI